MMLEEAKRLWQIYAEVHGRKQSSVFHRKCGEVERRLDDLEYLGELLGALAAIQRGVAYEHVHGDFQNAAIVGHRSIDQLDRAPLLVESFYWSAWRICSVVRYMPGFSKFEAAGIRNARNLLIEHVDYDAIKETGDIGWEPTYGFILRPGGDPHRAAQLRDPGFNSNFNEFRQLFESAAAKAIAHNRPL